MIEFFLGGLKWISERIWQAVSGRRRIQFLVHEAAFLGTGKRCYFLNVTNLSHDRELEITHVWFAANGEIHALPPDRPLLKRLKLDEPWETWVEADRLPPDLGESVFKMARLRLSNGRVIKSRKKVGVPAMGAVPGGAINYPPV